MFVDIDNEGIGPLARTSCTIKNKNIRQFQLKTQLFYFIQTLLKRGQSSTCCRESNDVNSTP